MISSIDLFYDDQDENERADKTLMGRLRRSLRDTSDPLQIPDNLFVSYFRLNKHAFKYVLSQISSGFKTTQSSAIPLFLKLACALRFLGSGSYQNGVGNDFELGLSQPTVSIVLSQVLDLLGTRICPVWINADMSTAEKQEARNYFFERARLPGIVGCVDGTHIGIIAPVELQHQYLNRKGFYSLNAMVACDNNGIIRFIDARYPGSTHDSFVWNHSELKELFERWWLNVNVCCALHNICRKYNMTDPEIMEEEALHSTEGRDEAIEIYVANITSEGNRTRNEMLSSL